MAKAKSFHLKKRDRHKNKIKIVVKKNTTMTSPMMPPAIERQHAVNDVTFVRPPKPLLINGDIPKNWKLWIQQYEWFEVATKMNDKSEQIAFMSSIGTDAIAIYNTFTMSGEDMQSLTAIKRQFADYFSPKINITFERYKFNKMSQLMGETFDDYITRLKSQSVNCNFDALHDELLRDKIIIGIIDDNLREFLLSEDLNLNAVILKCRAREMAINQNKSVNKSESSFPSVNAINKNCVKSKKKKVVKRDSEESETYNCSRCGTEHGKKLCPAYRKKCDKCKVPGHFVKMCRSNTKSRRKEHDVNNILVSDTSESENSDSEFIIDAITVSNADDEQNWFEVIKVNNLNVKFKLDSGAQCNVISKHVYKKIGVPLSKSKTKSIIAYTGHSIKVLGQLNVPVLIRKKWFHMSFVVVDVTPILGKKSCEISELIKRVKQVNVTNKSIYSGIGSYIKILCMMWI